MKMMILFGVFLGVLPFCLGRPTLNARQDALSRALDASIDQLNSQSWGRNLLKLSYTGKTSVKPLLHMSDQKTDEDVFEVSLQFSVRETVCDKDTTSDPTKCEFKAGPYMETPCKSQVMVYHNKALVVKARCNLKSSSSSESHSSEEMSLTIPSPPKEKIRNNLERFRSQWNPYRRKNQNINPRWEEEDRTFYPYLQE